MYKKLLRVLMFASKQILYACILQVMAMQLLAAKTTKSQSIDEVYVSVDFKGAKLLEVLKEIEKQTEFTFIYDNETEQHPDRFTFESKKISVKEVLTRVNKKAAFSFRQMNKNIAVKAAKKIKRTSLNVGSIRGTVKDAKGNYLPFATVRLKDQLIGTTTV